MAEHQNIDELLAKYLAEESPEEDFPEIQDHLNELPDGNTVFEHSKIIWDASAAFQQKKPCDINAAWQKVKKQMSCPSKLIKHFVELINNQTFYVFRINGSIHQKVHQTSWCCYQDIYSLE